MSDVNGMSVDQLRDLVAQLHAEPASGARNPEVVARWLGGRRSRVTTARGVTHIGGDGEPSPMQMLLGALAACVADVIATHASMAGVEIDALEVEASGHFDVLAYLGVDMNHGSGFQSVACTVRIDAPSASPEALQQLEDRARVSSPVGDSIARAVTLELRFRQAPTGDHHTETRTG